MTYVVLVTVFHHSEGNIYDLFFRVEEGFIICEHFSKKVNASYVILSVDK